MTTADHEPAPEPETARRERDGQPADLTRPSDYPVLAACLTCRREIRCGRWFRSPWVHTGDDE